MKYFKKETAWKKNRKFGDVKGGRLRPKLADNIFNRQHSLPKPTNDDDKPIFIIDNPSRDFFFPINIDEIKDVLKQLPVSHTNEITHIWLRKQSKKEYEKEGSCQGCFICGSGVNLIVIYPFSKSLSMNFGKKKPSKKNLKWYSKYNPELKKINDDWLLIWTEDKIKQYYLDGLLLHEIGHKIDSQYTRYWSKNYAKSKSEKFADNYAYYWRDKNREVIE